MANNYESLKTDGHYTLARRIFQKIKGWIQGKNYVTNGYISFTAPMVGVPNLFTIGVEHDDGTDNDLMMFQEGDNIAFNYIYSSGNVTGVTISSDQIDDSYTYAQYQNLPSSTKMKDKLFIVDDAPAPSFFRYESNTKTLIFENGYATYDEDTKTLIIGG